VAKVVERASRGDVKRAPGGRGICSSGESGDERLGEYE